MAPADARRTGNSARPPPGVHLVWHLTWAVSQHNICVAHSCGRRVDAGRRYGTATDGGHDDRDGGYMHARSISQLHWKHPTVGLPSVWTVVSQQTSSSSAISWNYFIVSYLDCVDVMVIATQYWDIFLQLKFICSSWFCLCNLHGGILKVYFLNKSINSCRNVWKMLINILNTFLFPDYMFLSLVIIFLIL